MKSYHSIVWCLFTLILFGGCASTETSNRKILVKEKLPRPGHIWVYNFAATPADVPADSELAGKQAEHSTAQTPEQIETGRQMGALIATQLVEEIRGMGLPAQRASSGTTTKVNDLVLRGYLLSIDEGSATKRVAVGFGSGSSELKAAVEGFQVTAEGMRKLGSGNVDSTGNKTPGGYSGGWRLDYHR